MKRCVTKGSILFLGLVWLLSPDASFAQQEATSLRAQETASPNVNGVLHVGGAIKTWSGSDLGAQVNAAYAAGPSTGVHIKILPGDYSYSTPISFDTAGKPMYVECDPGVQGNIRKPTATTRLVFTGRSGAAVTFNTGGGTGSGMSGCTLIGLGKETTTVGLVIGGSHGNVDTVYRNLDISEFKVGLQFGENAYIQVFENMQLHDNATNLFIPPGHPLTGENISFRNGAFWDKSKEFSVTCVDIEGSGEFRFDSVSLDQCGMTVNSPGVTVNFILPHFENPNAATSSPFLTLGPACVSCQVNTYGGEWLEDFASSRTEFIALKTGVHFYVYGGSYLAHQATPQLVSSSDGNTDAAAYGAFAYNFTNVFGGSYLAVNTFTEGLLSEASLGQTGLKVGSGTSNLVLFRPFTTGPIGGSTLGPETCASGTVTISGAKPNMVVVASPSTFPGASFTWRAYISAANTATVEVCNVTSGRATPNASTYNVRIIG